MTTTDPSYATAGQPHPGASAQAQTEAEKLPTVGRWGTDPTADPLRCPACGSPQPSMHPAMSGGGEVTSICPHPFHTDPTPPRTPTEALDLDAVEARADQAAAHTARQGWACCEAHASSEDVTPLLAEVRQLRAERDMLARAVVHPQRLVDATTLDTAPPAADATLSPGTAWIGHAQHDGDPAGTETQ